MQIQSQNSHEKSRMATDLSLLGEMSRMRSPTTVTAMSRPPLQEYESGRQTDCELNNTLKQLKKQMKGLKDENKVLRSELHSRNITIEKL